jgi:hypothetical protein
MMFDEKSRYAETETYRVVDARGREVTVVAVPHKPQQTIAGYHARRQGQRIDHLAAHYCQDSAGFWRICEANDVILPETLTEQAETAIPTKGGV